jgi:hypothetical protein
MPTCRSCHQRITWLKTPGGKAIPVDEDPTDDGNIVIDVERCQLVARVYKDAEAAREWAKANGLAMKSMFLDGTFVEVDGRPLLAGAAPQGPEPTSAAGQIAPGVYYEETETGAVAIHDSRRRWEPLSTPAKEPAQLKLGAGS